MEMLLLSWYIEPHAMQKITASHWRQIMLLSVLILFFRCFLFSIQWIRNLVAMSLGVVQSSAKKTKPKPKPKLCSFFFLASQLTYAKYIRLSLKSIKDIYYKFVPSFHIRSLSLWIFHVAGEREKKTTRRGFFFSFSRHFS